MINEVKNIIDQVENVKSADIVLMKERTKSTCEIEINRVTNSSKV